MSPTHSRKENSKGTKLLCRNWKTKADPQHSSVSSIVLGLPKVTMLFHSWITQTGKICQRWSGKFRFLELDFTGNRRELPQFESMSLLLHQIKWARSRLLSLIGYNWCFQVFLFTILNTSFLPQVFTVVQDDCWSSSHYAEPSAKKITGGEKR